MNNKARLIPFTRLGYILSVGIALLMAFSHYGYDDPFITYRYAENIRNGLGFVYNPGENILSTTTPLFALLLALFGKIGFSIPLTANAISVFSLAVGGLLIWDLAQSWKTPWVGYAGLLLYPIFPLLLSTIGSETPFYLALSLGAIVLYTRQHLGGAVLLTSLAVLTRSDGILLAFVLGCEYLWQRRADLPQRSLWIGLPWLSIFVAVSLLLGWHLFAWIYFGSPFPATLAAKQAQGAMTISTRFAPGLLRIASWYDFWPYWVAFGLAVVGTIYAFVGQRRWLLIFAWAGLYFLAYTWLGVSSYYWYYAPLVPAWIIAIGLGLAWIAHLPQQIGSSLELRLPQVTTVVLLAVLCVTHLYSLYNFRQRGDPRFSIYQAAGHWLADHTPQDATVGALEVGIIGYYGQRPMVDFAGLIQPPVAEQLQPDSTYEDAALWAVTAYQPDYLVLFASVFPRLRESYIIPNCRLVQQLSGDEYNHPADLLIFDCLP